MTELEFQIHVVEYLTKLDTKMATLVGNGQPGRINKLEDQVVALQKTWWTVAGIVAGVSALVTAAFHYLFK